MVQILSPISLTVMELKQAGEEGSPCVILRNGWSKCSGTKSGRQQRFDGLEIEYAALPIPWP
jgi:hypothetical protein